MAPVSLLYGKPRLPHEEKPGFSGSFVFLPGGNAAADVALGLVLVQDFLHLPHDVVWPCGQGTQDSAVEDRDGAWKRPGAAFRRAPPLYPLVKGKG